MIFAPCMFLPINFISIKAETMPIVKTMAKRAAQTCMRPIAASAWSRAPLNVVYRHLGWYAKRKFFGAFQQTFQRGSDFPIDPGLWNIEFVGKTLKLPLAPERMWLIGSLRSRLSAPTAQ